MKIMKVLDKTIGSTTYHKYRINLPIKMVEELQLANKELQIKTERGKIIIQKS